MTLILGISAYYHDSAACLVRDGEIVAAAQEERFSRIKHDHRFPKEAVLYCLKEAGVTLDQVEYVVFYDKPLRKFERLLHTYLSFAPTGIESFLKSMDLWFKEKLYFRRLLRKELLFNGKILFGDHHESHAASAFYPSPFDSSAILTLDGVGEWATASYGVGIGNEITLLKQIRFPHSVGLLYSAFTAFTGFRVNSGEYKLMGLAPYGEPRYTDIIKKELVKVHDDGSLHLNLKYFTFPYALQMTGAAFEKLFGPPRDPEGPISQRDMDLAKSIQEIIEEIVLKMAYHVSRETGMSHLCLAGGVALNCVANGRLLRHGPFKKIWIQPAGGDSGGAVGAALAVYHRYLGKKRNLKIVQSSNRSYADGMKGAFLGPAYTSDEIKSFLDEKGIPYEEVGRKRIARRIAELLTKSKVVGLFQGRLEFGPRSLGSRSIIADPRSAEMQSLVNLKIKFRESFRPFAPAILRNHVNDYFDLNEDSPYMLIVANVKEKHHLKISEDINNLQGLDKLKVPRSTIPAVTHVDYSARIQTVDSATNPFFFDVITEFKNLTGCPIVLNTSFNVRGEPIVCSPEDAYNCFMRTHLDYLILDNFILDKARQPMASINIPDLNDLCLD